MSINLNLTSEDVESTIKKPMKLHYIPATIGGDGPANLEKFFTPYVETLPGGILQNALRGYPLLGKQTTLPEGYTGVVFQETKKPLSSEDDRTLTFGGAFREFTYWNYDRNPTRNDPFEKALTWLQLAEVLHNDEQDEQNGKQPETKSDVKTKQEKSGYSDPCMGYGRSRSVAHGALGLCRGL